MGKEIGHQPCVDYELTMAVVLLHHDLTHGLGVELLGHQPCVAVHRLRHALTYVTAVDIDGLGVELIGHQPCVAV